MVNLGPKQGFQDDASGLAIVQFDATEELGAKVREAVARAISFHFKVD